MELEESIKLLKEMQENCKNKTIYKDEKAEAKAEAIEVVLKEVEEREKRYWKREERFLDMYNREKEKHEEIYNDLLDERDENYIPKEKIREYIKEKEEEKEGVKNISLEEYAITSKELKESEICLLKCLLEED